MTVLPSRVVLGVLLLLAVFADGAAAQRVSFPGLADPLPGQAGRTYLDLVRLVVPGLVAGSDTYSGGQPIDVRHIGGGDPDDIEVAASGPPRMAAVSVRSGGMDRLALLLTFDRAADSAEGFTVLALLDAAAGPRLLDAANVAFDRFTSFLDTAVLPVGAGDDLLLTRSTHFNSSQGYATTALMLARNGRLELVDTISTFDDRACGHERTQRLDVRRGAGEPFSDIVATVTERTMATGRDCGEASVPGTRTMTVTYRWDAAAQRYLPDSDAFVMLARENEQRF